MFSPDDPLTPPAPDFDEPWQAQVLAMADALVAEGHISKSDWADALGAALRSAEEIGAPDTLETYFVAVLTALESLGDTHTGLTREDLDARKAAWEEAYLRTPHGEPIEL